MTQNSRSTYERQNGSRIRRGIQHLPLINLLGTRFIGLVLFTALLAGVGGGWILISISRNSIRQEALNNNLTQAELVAEFTSNYMSEIQSHLRVFATRPDLRQAVFNNTLEQMQPALSQFAQVETTLDSVGIYDMNGTQRATSILNAIGQSFADETWFLQASTSGRNYQDIPQISKATGRLVILYAVPILDELGHTRGVLAGAISTNTLADTVLNIKYGPDTRTSIIDLHDGGIIIADSLPQNVTMQFPSGNAASGSLMLGGSGAIEDANDKGDPTLTGFAPVFNLPWEVVVSTPKTTALAIINTLTRDAIISTGLIILIASGLGTLVVVGVTKPLRRLVVASKDIGRGNLDLKLNTDGKDEVGDLSRSIAQMAQDLKTTLVSRDQLLMEVHERKNAEAKLSEVSLHLETVLTAVPDIIMEIYTNKVYTWANKEGIEFFGNDVIGKEAADYFEGEQDTYLKLQPVFDRSEATVYVESWQRRKDGEKRLLAWWCRALKDDTNTITGALLAGQDITQRKRDEEEYQQLREKAEVSTRLAAVGEMAAGIAHEINNPLTGVIGFSELLMERDLPDDVKEELKIINAGSQRVKAIVKRMLTFARQNKPLKTRASITELIDNTLELRSYVLQTANIEVVKNYVPDLPWLNVDTGQLQQVFLNLIVNSEYAIKKTNKRGTITITGRRIGENIRLTFSDDGPGMTEDVKNKLFQPFFTTKDPGEGTGLGLSLSYSIILEHNGTITVESEFGHGATFIIDLPIAPGSPEQPAKEIIEKPVKALKQARVLVIDDEPAIRSLIRAILSETGHTIEESGMANDALEKLNQGGFDVILMDVRMPGMNGMELYGSISNRWPDMSHRIIFITGDTSDTTIKQFLNTNRISYIAKPFDRLSLENKVNEVLANRVDG
jgi:PAS domain S-box-containing protein